MSRLVTKRPAPLADRTTRLARNRRFRELGLPYKACPDCFTVKALARFHKSGYCAECVRKRNAVRRADPEKYATDLARQREYDRDRYANDKGFAEAHRYSMRKWARDNPDKHRAKGQRRRARKAEASVEPFSSADLFAHWESIGAYGCVYCDGPYEHDDHVQPLALGGERVEPVACLR
jgi:hypothetical protein